MRVRPRPIEQESEEEDNSQDAAIQYYQAEPRQNAQKGNVVLIAEDEYNGYYGQQQARPRVDYRASPTKTPSPRTKSAEQQSAKSPPVQTIRNYSKVNDDGSFTFGYEAADGSFKEETRGTDCVVRGKYGYVDPDGNKREFTYVSGNPCDPDHPDETQSSVEESEEVENENVPQNYPVRRPTPIRAQSVRPLPSTTTPRPPTTVFQNNYSNTQMEESEEEVEEEEPVQYIQQPKASVTRRPYIQNTFAPQQEVRQRINTTPSTQYYQTSVNPVSITPRPSYRTQTQTQTLQTQPPATTYRPQVQIVSTQKPTVIYSRPALPATTPNSIVSQQKPAPFSSSPKGPIDFAAEFQKFQLEHNIASSTAPNSNKNTSKNQQKPKTQATTAVTVNPIYESQLVYDPSTGQYDSALYQQLPQTDGDFSLSQRIQPYVHNTFQPHAQPLAQNRPQLVTLEQLQQQSPLYQRPISSPRPILPPQFSQEVYQKSQENLQVLNSQQLFQQQQELQQAQLQQDRLEAAKRTQNSGHRFELERPQAQSFYYIQPTGQSTGQIDEFLRGHNLEY